MSRNCTHELAVPERNVLVPPIVYINEYTSLQLWEPVMMEAFVIGMDAEWPPQETMRGSPTASLLQLACQLTSVSASTLPGQGDTSVGTRKLSGECIVFVIDLYLLDNLSEMKRIFCDIMKKQDCLKLGHSLDMDINAVSRALGCQNLTVECAVDVRALFKRLYHMGFQCLSNFADQSLSGLLSTVLGKPLDKTLQCSAWGERPLSEKQIEYAANDAYALVELFWAACRYREMEKDAERSAVEFGQRWVWHDGRYAKVKSTKFWTCHLYTECRVIRSHRCKQRSKESWNIAVLPQIIPWTQEDKQELEPRFLSDVMLHGLARQLRLWGIDSESFPVMPKSERHVAHRRLIELAEKDHRVILTKDITLFNRQLTKQLYLVRAEDKKSQLREIISQFSLSVHRGELLSRCPQCNGTFGDIPVSCAELPDPDAVPAGVLNSVKQFFVCNQCNAVYWKGNQYHRAMERLELEFSKLHTSQ